ncbi:MAG: hypothetical protein V8R21_10030 [Dysosmobacter sp.]
MAGACQQDYLRVLRERPAEDWITRLTFWFELGPDYWGYGMELFDGPAHGHGQAALSADCPGPKPMEADEALRGQTEFTCGDT